jgi:prolipoprotein diacylglyceryltransferase
MLPRHPTQLYEAISYFLIFGISVWIYLKYQEKLKSGFLFGFYLVSIFGVRFMLEFVKTKQESYNNDLWFTTGQLLSIPFILLGLYMLLIYKKEKNIL